MSTSITIPSDYGYVLLTASLTSLVHAWHVNTTGRYRRAAKVPYPNAYATAEEAKASKEKYLFNCAQRAHVNFLENLPVFLPGLLLTGLQYPLTSSALGVAWCFFRVRFALGYLDPNQTEGRGRLRGNWFYYPELALLFGTMVVGANMVGLPGKVLGLLR